MASPNTVIDLLRDLVAIPSVNPHGNPGTDQTGEQAMGEYVADFLRQLGAEVELAEVRPGRPNVIATFEPEQPARAHLAYAPHLDTVSVAGMTIPPFDPALRDGKLWGRGASDTKGPMAAALWAVRDWAQSSARAQSRIRWTFLGLMGEEAGNDGAHAMVKRGFTSDLTLALEPTSLGVVTAHKGALWFEVRTTGLACHGSTPERGRNAIYAMGRILEAIESRIIPAVAQHTHGKLGNSSVNVGTITGGSKINIVPDACMIEIDCRVVPSVKPEELRLLIEAELRASVPDVEVTIQRFSAPLDTDETLPWVARLGAVSPGFTTAPWFSDASVLGGPHCPAVCVGPGSIAQAHTKDEFVQVSDIEEGAVFFSRWMRAAEQATHEP